MDLPSIESETNVHRRSRSVDNRRPTEPVGFTVIVNLLSFPLLRSFETRNYISVSALHNR